MKQICVFAGSSPGARAEYGEAARQLGRELLARGLGLVYGGGNVGLMGILADTVLAGGGTAIGVIPRALLGREVGHTGLTELRVVDSMHERKAVMAELAEGFAVLPGGIGTFEETFEIATWAQLGIHTKPVGILNVAGYYDPLIRLLDHAVGERFLRPEHRALLLVGTDAAALLDALVAYRAPVLAKWMDRGQA